MTEPQIKFNAQNWPAMPEGLPIFDISENAKKVMDVRYVRKNEKKELLETREQTIWRVAYNVANSGNNQKNVQEVAIDYYKLIATKKFMPNTPTFTGAGTPLGQLSACFVLPIDDDMGKDPHGNGIMTTLRNATLIQQTGGGNGFSFSRLRPSGA